MVHLDARKGQEKGNVDLRAFQLQNRVLQAIHFKKNFGRGEWIRTTDLLVPKLVASAISMSTKQIFSCKTSI